MNRRFVQHGMLSRLACGVALIACVTQVAVGQEARSTESKASKLPGRIYVGVTIRGAPPRKTNRGGLFEARQIIRIDPVVGTREVIVPDGTEPRVSPNGIQLAYQRTEVPADGIGDTKRQLCILDLARPNSMRVLCDANWMGGWDRRGRQLAINTFDEVGRGYRMECQMVDSLNASRATSNILASDIVVDCSPTSNTLLVSQGGAGADPLLYTVSTDGKNKKSIGDWGVRGRFSPDGRYIAFVRHYEPTTACISDLDGRIVQKAFVASERMVPSELCWSPDGRHLAIVAHRVPERHDTLVIVTATGQFAKELKLEVDDASPPDWK